MERKLIFEDKSVIETANKDLAAYSPFLNAFRKAYKGLEIGVLTTEVFAEVVAKGISKVELRFWEAKNTELDAMGVSSTSLREDMLEKFRSDLEKFNDAYSDLKRFQKQTVLNRPTLLLHHITYAHSDKASAFIIDEKSEKEILETHGRVYLENEEEAAAWENMQSFSDAYNKMTEILNKNAPFRGTVLGILPLHRLFHLHRVGYELATIQPNPIFFKDAITYAARLAEHNAKN